MRLMMSMIFVFIIHCTAFNNANLSFKYESVDFQYEDWIWSSIVQVTNWTVLQGFWLVIIPSVEEDLVGAPTYYDRKLFLYR